jgi:DNA-directed RNA polymerase sigma subunit (sigma70/sigma32)
MAYSFYSYGKESCKITITGEVHKRFGLDAANSIISKKNLRLVRSLSKKYNRKKSRLDGIPNCELDQLARWNFTDYG